MLDTSIYFLAIILVEFVYIVYKDKTNNKIISEYREERKDLLNRIMSRDVVEYSSIQDGKVSSPRNTIKNNLYAKEDFPEELYR